MKIELKTNEDIDLIWDALDLLEQEYHKLNIMGEKSHLTKKQIALRKTKIKSIKAELYGVGR